MTLLQVSNINKSIDSKAVLRSISFTQRKFQKIAIAGETGSGKSTLLKIIAGLVQPDNGQVFFNGEEVKGPAHRLVPGHPDIAYLSQHFELAHSLRVEQVLSYANVLSAEAANDLYEVCQVSHLLKRRTDELSGGERQRIALTRLLISAPKLLLLDEPFSNLDRGHEHILEKVIESIGKKLKITIITVSHEPLEILSWADKILVMKEGKIIQKGPPEKIYRQPINEYTAALFGKYSLVNPEVARELLSLNTVIPKGKKMLVRPENFQISDAKRKGAPGKVVRSNFFGSFYEVDVMLKDVSIVMRSSVPFDRDKKLMLTVDRDRVWFI